MKILIATYHYPPELSGGTARALLLEQHMTERGHDVTILAPRVRTEGEYGAKFISVAPVHKAKNTDSGPPSGPGLPLRRTAFRMVAKVADTLLVPDRLALWAGKAAKKAANALAGNRPDLIITTSPPESTHLIGLALSAKLGSYWIADIRDGWMCEPLRPQANWPVRGWLEARLEARVFGRADRVSFVSRMTLADAARRYPELEHKFDYFPTGFGERAAAARNDKNGDERFTIAYAGRFGLSHATRTPRHFLEAVKNFCARNPAAASSLRVRFYGNFTRQEAALFRELEERGVVHVHEPLDHDDMLRQLSRADVLLLITAPGHLTAAPRKLFDYLAVGRPILALAEGSEADRVVTQTGSGVVAPPGDVAGIESALEKMWSAWKKGELADMCPCSGADSYLSDKLIDAYFRKLGFEI